MPGMDVFKGDPFSLISLSGVVREIDYRPSLLGELGIFEPMPIRTREVLIDREDSVLKLIPVSPLGTPPNSHRGRDRRSATTFSTTRLVEDFTLYSYEMDGVRQTGSEGDLMAAQTEFLKLMGQTREDMEVTFEHHRLGALQGKLLDADGTSVLYDYFAEFGVAEPAPIVAGLGDDTVNLRTVCNEVVRDMARSSRGAFTPRTSVHALAGDEFFDGLTTHPSVERTFLNWSAAENLRDGTAFQAFTFGGIVWHNYRGTDDDALVAIPTDEAKLFPVGARETFKHVMAPYEGLDNVGELGEELYSLAIPDDKRDQWVRGEIYSYPLFICQRPGVLRTMTAA